MFRVFGGKCMFHTACCQKSKIGRTMNKVMGGSRKKKSFYNSIPVLPNTSSFQGKVSFESKITGTSRRSSILNKLFIRHITDLMSTAPCSELVELNIEINKVKITGDYKLLKVYWIARETNSEEYIQEVLQRNANLLRHELSQLRVMGVVPTIVFVRDKSYAQAIEVDKCLTRADFGEDHVPTDAAECLKSEFQLWTNFDNAMKKKIEAIDNTINNDEMDDLSDLPPMPHNIFGLDHAEIMSKVKKAMKKSEASHRHNSATEKSEVMDFKHLVNEDPVRFESHKAQREAFKAFLVQRQILKSKTNKEDKNWKPDEEYVKEELRAKCFTNLEGKDEALQEDDYIIEHFEEYSDNLFEEDGNENKKN